MKRAGFTLLELMIAAAVLVVALLGLLGVFTGCFGLNETARNLTIAINGAQEKLEEMRNHDFATIVSDYALGGSPGNNFSVSGWSQSHSGIVEVNSINPDLLTVTVTVCWRQKGGRIIGEDADLNGTFLTTEDTNPANGQLDSPAQIVTLMAERR